VASPKLIKLLGGRTRPDELDAEIEGIDPGNVDRLTEAKLLREWKERHPAGLVRDIESKGIVAENH
jgi:hypothetical protein